MFSNNACRIDDHAIAIIDGTGPRNDGDYAVAMAESFCTQLRVKFGKNARYERGPSAAGFGIEDKAMRAADFLLARKKSGTSRLFLAGYSRGGSAVLHAAWLMGQKGVSVDGMVLFDPVRMHVSGTKNGIPTNVVQSVAFIRPPDPAFVAKYAGKIDDDAPGFLGEWVDNPIRPGWSEAIESATLTCTPDHMVFRIRGSHGALGGVGWKVVTEDPAAQSKVVSETNKYLSNWGLMHRLYSPTIR